MVIQKVSLVYFSATGITKKYLEAMAEVLERETVTYDFTLPAHRAAPPPRFTKEDFVILGLPVYYGRVPVHTLEYVKGLRGEGTPCVVVGSFGNRHFDDALAEMEDLMTDGGFAVAGGAAVVGRHSFTDEIAGGRPGAKDLAEAKAFILRVAAKDNPTLEKGVIAGGRPYRDGGTPPAFGPSTTSACTDCKLCARLCPMGIISMEDVTRVTAPTCIKCNRCVTVCPVGAKVFDQEPWQAVVNRCIAGFAQPPRPNSFFE